MTEPNANASTPATQQRPQISVAVAAAYPRVTGNGFLPAHSVTIRIGEPDDTMTYIAYCTDADGTLEAALPPTLPHGTLTISATDERVDTADETGRLWANIATIAW